MIDKIGMKANGLKRWILIAGAAASIGLYAFDSRHYQNTENARFNNRQVEFIELKKKGVSDSILSSKIFPFLSLVLDDPQLMTVFRKDKAFQIVEAEMKARIARAIAQCDSVECMADAAKWTANEVDAIEKALQGHYAHSSRLQQLVVYLKMKGFYSADQNASDTSVLRLAWEETAAAYHHIIDVYIAGKPPTYIKIDSISFQKTDPAFRQQVKALFAKQLLSNKTSSVFSLLLQLAIETLQLNGRDEAARYEPVNEGENRLPFAKIKNTDWSSYRYSSILIPGLGPETAGVALAPGNIRRCEDGAMFYSQGLAPFIVVSGGHVHPFKTPFNEAVEMKKYLVQKLGVPDDAVFIEPHARHTTTNLRNTNRLLYRFGIPTDKPVLIVTDSSQSSYIVKGMDKVALRDLGYLPYERISRINDKETSYYPTKFSFRLNPADPLDP
jgi:hypothetical protein